MADKRENSVQTVNRMIVPHRFYETSSVRQCQESLKRRLATAVPLHSFMENATNIGCLWVRCDVRGILEIAVRASCKLYTIIVRAPTTIVTARTSAS